jgi:hypothetical protein
MAAVCRHSYVYKPPATQPGARSQIKNRTDAVEFMASVRFVRAHYGAPTVSRFQVEVGDGDGEGDGDGVGGGDIVTV